MAIDRVRLKIDSAIQSKDNGKVYEIRKLSGLRAEMLSYKVIHLLMENKFNFVSKLGVELEDENLTNRPSLTLALLFTNIQEAFGCIPFPALQEILNELSSTVYFLPDVDDTTKKVCILDSEDAVEDALTMLHIRKKVFEVNFSFFTDVARWISKAFISRVSEEEQLAT